jgi:hypothetical protein
VLERGGRALLLPAPSGSGKSTLCAGLAFNGWRLLSDELALLDPCRLGHRPASTGQPEERVDRGDPVLFARSDLRHGRSRDGKR